MLPLRNGAAGVVMTTTFKDIHAALTQKCGYEVVMNTEKPQQLRIIGRIVEDKEGRKINNWLLIIDRLLEAAFDNRPWTIDICKHYFKRGKGQPLIFGWRIILQAEKVAEHYADIVNLIKTAPTSARAEVTEMPLVGSSIHRNSTAGGKRGAGPMGTIPVGPAAALQKNLGG
jgi:hypothetical protein